MTITYFVAFIILGIYTSFLGPTLPALAEHTKTSLDQISILFAARALGYLLGSMFLGKFFDQLPGHYLLVAVLFSMGVAAALVPLAPLLWLLVVVMLVLGIGEGALDVGANLMLMWVQYRNTSPFLNALHFFFGLGAVLGPVIVAQTLLIGGNSIPAFYIIALIPLPIILALLKLPSPRITQKESEPGFQAANPLLVFLLAMLFFFYVGAESSFGGWIFTYATSIGLSDAANAAYLTSLFWGALTSGRLLSIPIAARLRPMVILFTAISGCIASILGILTFPQSNKVLLVGTFGLGFFMAPIFPTILAYAQRRMTMSGRVTRWFFVATGAGSMFLPWLVGQLFEPLGSRSSMIIIFADLLAAMLVFLLSNAFTRRERPI
jgi:FHS family Na+ dependent glucose MFS transporter 1